MTLSPSLCLKICLHNVENLFLLFDELPRGSWQSENEIQWQKRSTSIYPNKPLKKTLELAQIFKDIDADIFMLCEVGGPESLNNFNQLFLDGKYSTALIEGNSDRNIDVGFLIRKNMGFYFDLQSNKDRPINYLYPHQRPPTDEFSDNLESKHQSSQKFSRDAAELRLFMEDVDKPFLMILLTHLKSRLDPERIDPQGFERRQAELLTLVEVQKEMRQKSPNTPLIVAGDFNGHAGRPHPDPEFEALYLETDLQDVLELSETPKADRATYYQLRNNHKADGRQIDFCFLSKHAQTLLKKSSPHVYRFKDEYGLKMGIPTTLEAKLNLPSDHYPLVFELENFKL
jgi:hypothetical protein